MPTKASASASVLGSFLDVILMIESQPATQMKQGSSRQFETAGLAKKHWSTASPIRRIFREAFVRADMPCFNPHSFRKTLVQFGEKVCKSPEEFKAWSQNLGHEKVLTTFLSYGEVACQRQGDIIRNLAKSQQAINSDTDKIAEAVVKKLNESQNKNKFS